MDLILWDKYVLLQTSVQPTLVVDKDTTLVYLGIDMYSTEYVFLVDNTMRNIRFPGNTNLSEWFRHTDAFAPPPMWSPPTCECGAEAVGSDLHSRWCAKHDNN